MSAMSAALRKRRRAPGGMLCFLAVLAGANNGTVLAAGPPPPRPFQPLVQRHLDAYVRDHQIAGAVAGVAYHGDDYAFTTGVRNRDTGAPMTPETMFPLGSITKIFTGIMIAHLVNEGAVRLDEPVVAFLPPDVARLGGAIREVTWLDLATHTSGMTGPAPGNPAEQAYFDLPPSPDLVADWIGWKPSAPPTGAPYRYEYSNKGFLTLAFAVAQAGQRGGYNALFQEVFRQPLHLDDLQTLGTMPAETRAQVVTGYGTSDDPEERVGNGVNANLVDLAPFLRACLLSVDTPAPLWDAIELSQRPARSKLTVNPDAWMGLGWDIQRGTPYTIDKGGATAGVFSQMTLRPRQGLGVIAIANGKPAQGSDIVRVANELIRLVESNGDREVARGRPTTHSAGVGANLANDGNKTGSTFWAAQSAADWWQVDLGSPQVVGYFHALPAWDDVAARGDRYTVSTSLDGIDWSQAVDAREPEHPPTFAGNGHRIAPRFVRFVRVQSVGAPLRLVEFEVFEHPDGPAAALELAQPTLSILRDGDGQPVGFEFVYRRLTAETGLGYAVSVSRDLRAWEPPGADWGAPSVEGEASDLIERVTWRTGQPGAPDPTGQFLRLLISPR
ncbi:MAG: serine hydrolase [Limisphaerales bacterium]